MAAAETTYQRSSASLVTVTSHSIPPSGVHIWVSAVRPTFPGSAFAHMRSRYASAPGPLSSNLAKLVWSITPTASRTARHSSPTAECQLARR